jgi:hypothetical protein
MNLEGLKLVVILVLPTAAISVTITRASVFEPLRVWVGQNSKWLGKLISCPYCLSHWVSFLMVAIYQPVVIQSSLRLVDLLSSAFAIVALTSPISWLVYRSFKSMEPQAESDEVKMLREALLKAKQKIIAQGEQIKAIS